MVQSNQKAVKKALSGMFTVSTFYKDIVQIWNQSMHSTTQIDESKIEDLMKIAENFIEGKEYNTDALEACIRDNEDFLAKHRSNNTIFHAEIYLHEDEVIDKDVDEHYLGASPALEEASKILENAKMQTKPAKTQRSSSSKKEKEKDTQSQSVRSQREESLLNRVGSPSRISYDQILNFTQSSIQKQDEDTRSQRFNQTYQKPDYTALESIAEKDFEEKDDFKLKWNRYVSLIDTALHDRK